jgi:thiamine pyrophosphate-dependent acetolactate synthase large subunit-like protein
MSEIRILDRRDTVARLLKDRRDLLVVSGLGAPTYDVAAAGDHPRNFYLWGAMGGAAMIGYGLALAQPRTPVLVVTGDGEMLMGMGALATIAVRNPGNLTIVVLDNGLYGETGGQKTHTAHRTDLVAVARACGIAEASRLATITDVDALAPRVHAGGGGTRFAVAAIDAAEPPRVLPARDGVFLKNRMRAALDLPVT